jgi:hypothetical protein
VDVADLHAKLQVVPGPYGHVPALPQFAVYRGCACASWALEHSLSRTKGDYAAKELEILKAFCEYSVRDLQEEGIDTHNDLQVMALGQHYGVPTRLLDWSRDPNVALHFATAANHHASEDGAVWVVNPHVVHAVTLAEPVRKKLCPGRPADPQILNYATVMEIYPNVAEFDMHFVVGAYMPTIFFEPARFDERMVRQKGLFSLVGNPNVQLLEILESVSGSCRKIVLPAALKKEIRADLDARENDERAYFPGMDGVGRFLTRNRAD